MTFARTAESVCMGLDFDSNKSECVKIINSGYISSSAAGVCGDLDFDSGANECLEAALNKEYTRGAAQICSSNSFDSGVVDCMKNSGSRHEARDVYEVTAKEKLGQIERLARNVKRDIRNGYLVEALTGVIRIIDIATITNY
jgi:hypothetical protein